MNRFNVVASPLVCVVCSRLKSPSVADTEGEPYKSYYCFPCAGKKLEEMIFDQGSCKELAELLRGERQ